MGSLKIVVLLLLLSLNFISGSPVNQYLDLNGAYLMRFQHNDHIGLFTCLESLQASLGSQIDIWKVTQSTADIFVAAITSDAVLSRMTQHGYTLLSKTPYTVFPQETIATSLTLNSSKIRSVSTISLDVYHTYSQINEWLDLIATECGGLCSVSDIGVTIEERSIKVIKIGKEQCGEKQKIFIDCGIHAREWVSPAVCLYIISQLLNSYGADVEVTEMVDKYDWYIVPLMNPDGYSYSMTSNRLWRKNRRVNSGSSCFGVDLNRNWDYEYGVSGASSNPCDQTYKGEYAFSEPEAQHVANYALSLGEIHSYLTYHSYGQYILYVWGYDRLRAPNWENMDAAGRAYNSALQSVNGTSYSVGQSGRDLYPAAGASDDWFYGAAKAKFSYTIELRDTGTYGFILPDSLILPTADENFAGLKGYISFLENNQLIVQTGSCETGTVPQSSTPGTAPPSTTSMDPATSTIQPVTKCTGKGCPKPNKP